ncbi:MAG: peptidoglycan DD-metalloendopeptidase family protein [Rhizobiaceae bacterium]
MRSVVMGNRIRRLLKASSLGVLGVAIAGCSSGFQRFDTSVYDEAIPQQASQAQNPYPGDVDTITTASTGNNTLAPIEPVAPQGVYHNPEPTHTTSQVQTYQTPNYSTAQTQRYRSNNSSGWGGSSISGTSLPKPVAETVSETKTAPISYAPPKPDSEAVYIAPANTDKTTTASIKNTRADEGGWTSTGGTTITIREGETLYNLSKRYGVPVTAIRQANGYSNTDVLKTGQRVTIPNYIYSREAAISAPDNNPKTRAASAGTGYVGEAKNSSIVVPTKKPYKVAALNVENSSTDTRSAISPGSIDTYTVQAGDSLSKIASRHGTTVAALQSTNNITGSNIQIGQKLVLNGKLDQTNTALVKEPEKEVDPIVTGTVKDTSDQTQVASVDTDTPAPERTGISDFRWPVKGRIVSEFGDSASNGKNEGIDISVPEGTAVRAAENGVVIYAGNEISAYGNLVLIRHTDDWVSAYAHNRDFEVEKGDTVRRGQIIARSGKTGKADHPKLHFELRKASKAVNPKKYLAGA